MKYRDEHQIEDQRDLSLSSCDRQSRSLFADETSVFRCIPQSPQDQRESLQQLLSGQDRVILRP